MFVSVPLRGCGFEMIQNILEDGGVEWTFPSPCGDVVLKLLCLSGYS